MAAVNVATQQTRRAYVASSADVWAIGIATVICGQYFAWNAGLVAGPVRFGYGVLLTALAFLFLVMSLAEIASALPFAGGVFGMARCTLGFYVAFVVGCCEMVQYVIYSGMTLVLTTHLVSLRWPCVVGYEPVPWVALQAIVLLGVRLGGRPFWRTLFGLSTLSLVVVFFYALCAMSNADMATYGGGAEVPSQEGLVAFFQALPHAVWLFSGIESLATLPAYVEDPCKAIPKGQLASMATLLLSSCCIYLAAISFPPGAAALPGAFAVLSGGFSVSFNVTEVNSNLLSIPAIVAGLPGFSLATSNILAALARSNLVSTIVIHRSAPNKTPMRAIVLVSGLNIATSWALQSGHCTVLYNLARALGFVAYIAQGLGFIAWRRRHNRVPRRYISPVGMAGATYSVVVFSLGCISTLCCQEDSFDALIATTGLVAVLTAYYHGYAKRHQTFSTDEHMLLFFGRIESATSVHAEAKNKASPRSRWSRVRSQLRLFLQRQAVVNRRPTVPTRFPAIAPSLLTQRSESRCATVRVGGLLS
ncbi:hypothetical protein DYB32_008834 [Aphanomyces invadans]|uniref:Amino acid permease/ SLC12A domain-containing protein n=1 Tax=Aphanomyces invadans TaxID=157072 RepID=A0A3R6Y2J2_9STRA|nr:hypothetical protein DYB32_008834 [Aphanomyces invadans]